MTSLILPLLLALIAVAIGWFGWRNAAELAERTQHRDSYAQRVNVLRRGAVACWVVGLALAVAPVVAVLTSS